MREKSGVVRALAARLSAGPATPELTRYETFCRSDELPQDFSSTRRETNPHPDSTSGVSDVEVDDGQTNEDSPMDLSMKSSTTSPHSTTPSSPLSTGLPRERGVKRARLESMVNQLQVRLSLGRAVWWLLYNNHDFQETKRSNSKSKINVLKLQTKRIERQPIEISPVHSDYPKTTLHLEDSWDEQQSSETLSSSVSPGLSSLEDSFRPRTFSDGALLGQYMHRRHKALQERASKVRLPTLPHPDFNAPMLEVNAPLRHQVRKTPVPQSVPDAPPALLESLLTRVSFLHFDSPPIFHRIKIKSLWIFLAVNNECWELWGPFEARVSPTTSFIRTIYIWWTAFKCAIWSRHYPFRSRRKSLAILRLLCTSTAVCVASSE